MELTHTQQLKQLCANGCLQTLRLPGGTVPFFNLLAWCCLSQALNVRHPSVQGEAGWAGESLLFLWSDGLTVIARESSVSVLRSASHCSRSQDIL